MHRHELSAIALPTYPANIDPCNAGEAVNARDVE